MERSDIEVLELDEAEPGDPFTPEKLVGVAFLGACTSLVGYYLFYQVDPERRQRIKEGFLSALKGQVRKWGEEEP